MSHVTGFGAWYDDRRRPMKADPARAFFLELRNISQHKGPVSCVGGSIPHTPGRTYRFAGTREDVPAVLVGRYVAAACGEHLANLASAVGVPIGFPHESFLHSTLSAEGIRRLRYSLDSVGNSSGSSAWISKRRARHPDRREVSNASARDRPNQLGRTQSVGPWAIPARRRRLSHRLGERARPHRRHRRS